MNSAEEYRTNYSNVREEYDTIIKHTREMIRNMPIERQYEKAKAHILDALHNKPPRPVYMSDSLSRAYYVLQWVQSSLVWDWTIFLLSYLFMYLVVLEGDSFGAKVGLESAILTVFFTDTFMDFYFHSFDYLKRKNRYPSILFWKLGLLMLMLVDLIVFIALPAREGQRPIRVFRVLRACKDGVTQLFLRCSTRRCVGR